MWRKGSRDSYRVFEDRFETQSVAHCCLEPHASVAQVTLMDS